MSNHPHKIQLDTKLKGSDAKASLGIANRLQAMLLPNTKNAQNQASEPQNPAPQQEQTPEPTPTAPQEDLGAKMTEMELNFTKQLDSMRQEMKADQTKEMESIKAEITKALNE